MSKAKTSEEFLTIPMRLLHKDLLLAEVILLCLVDHYNKLGRRKTFKHLLGELGYSEAYAGLLSRSLREKGYLSRKTLRDRMEMWTVNLDPNPEAVENSDVSYGNKRRLMRQRYQACGKLVEKPGK